MLHQDPAIFLDHQIFSVINTSTFLDLSTQQPFALSQCGVSVAHLRCASDNLGLGFPSMTAAHSTEILRHLRLLSHSNISTLAPWLRRRRKGASKDGPERTATNLAMT